MSLTEEVVFRRLSGIVREELDWPTSRFMASDPMALLGVERYDGLDSVHCLDRIENEFGIRLTEEEIDHLWANMTIGELAMLLCRKVSESSSRS